MKFLDLVKQRRSVRTYLNTPVEQEKIDYMLSCAQSAPSAVNKQAWKFYVLTGESLCEIKKTYDREWLKQAPLCIVITGNHDEAWHRAVDDKDHTDVDVSIAAEHIVLAAQEQGLASCWICNFDIAMCREQLALSENEEPIVILSLGYAAPEAASKPRTTRKSLSETVVYKR